MELFFREQKKFLKRKRFLQRRSKWHQIGQGMATI